MDENDWEGPLQEFGHAELRSNTCIRLVQIHIELFRGDISCTLQQHETDTETYPNYAALSYVWGDPTPTHTIYINKRIYRIHKSLWGFLSHSRAKEDTAQTWFWTDLLCIDQAHHSEKNEQISRMGDIYAQAAYVVSWLGTHGETADAIGILVEITKGIDTGCTPKYAWNSWESKQIHKACDQLAFREPYWGRVWILQEVACATDCIVACGDTSVNFEELQDKMVFAMKSSVRFDASDRDRRMERFRVLRDLKISIYKRETIKILELIEMTEFCEATRWQDRIYGLLGMAGRLDSGFDSRVLEVSQHKTLTDVWWDMIFMILDQESNFGIKRDLASLGRLVKWLPPPRKHAELEMGSSSRRACAEAASHVFEAAYSRCIQGFLGIYYSQSGYKKTDRTRQHLQTAWLAVIEHIYKHEHHVPGLQTRLGWSIYASLRFSSLDDLMEGSPGIIASSLPIGWLCVAHSPDAPSKFIEKHPIMGTYSIKAPPEDRFCPLYCSGAEGDETPCDLSLVMLKIEQLGVTCVVRSGDTVEIDFYCGCCDPSNASVTMVQPRTLWLSYA